MKKLLVILHVFYREQLDLFIEKLKNINGCDWDLIITSDNLREKDIKKVRDFRSDAQIIRMDNCGYDVWPFIQVIRSVSIEKYDYILKLHTKNVDKTETIRLNGLKLDGKKWNDLLINSILKSPEQFRSCIDRLENNPRCGMVCSYELYVSLTKRRPEDMSMLMNEAERIGVKIKHERFCAGTMFMIRPECLKKIIKADFEPSMWKQGSSHAKGTLAHVYERLFSIVVADAGYYCNTIATYKVNAPRVFMHRHISPILKQAFTISRYGEDSKKCLIILGQRIMLE